MNLKKYISKHFIIRLCLLLALVSAAAVFDMYHSVNQKLANNIRRIPSHDDAGSGKTFYFNQIPSFNLKTSSTEFSIPFRFAFTQDKFLLKHYNLRTFQILKAEQINSMFSTIGASHFLPFNRVLYASPDDTPPLS